MPRNATYWLLVTARFMHSGGFAFAYTVKARSPGQAIGRIKNGLCDSDAYTFEAESVTPTSDKDAGTIRAEALAPTAHTLERMLRQATEREVVKAVNAVYPGILGECGQ